MICPDLFECEGEELLFGLLQPALNDRQAFGCDRYRSIGLLQLLNQQLDEIILELLGRQRGERKALAGVVHRSVQDYPWAVAALFPCIELGEGHLVKKIAVPDFRK